MSAETNAKRPELTRYEEYRASYFKYPSKVPQKGTQSSKAAKTMDTRRTKYGPQTQSVIQGQAKIR